MNKNSEPLSKEAEEEILQEYLKMFPKEEHNGYFIESYQGSNGNFIQGKKLKCLNFFTEKNYINTVFIDAKEEDFWKKIDSSIENKIYLLESSIVFDFNDNYYYELAPLNEIIINNEIVKNNKIIIVKFNFDLNKVERDVEVDIIIL